MIKSVVASVLLCLVFAASAQTTNMTAVPAQTNSTGIDWRYGRPGVFVLTNAEPAVTSVLAQRTITINGVTGSPVTNLNFSAEGLSALRMWNYGDPNIIETPDAVMEASPGVVYFYGGSVSNIVVPFMFNGSTVTQMIWKADNTQFKRNVKSIVVPKSVVSIGNGWMFATSTGVVETITFNGSVTLGSTVMRGCPLLTNVTFKGDAGALGVNPYYGSSNVVNYVANPTACGWSNSFGNRPVVFPVLNGGSQPSSGVETWSRTDMDSWLSTNTYVASCINTWISNWSQPGNTGYLWVSNISSSVSAAATAALQTGGVLTNVILAGNVTVGGVTRATWPSGSTQDVYTPITNLPIVVSGATNVVTLGESYGTYVVTATNAVNYMTNVNGGLTFSGRRASWELWVDFTNPSGTNMTWCPCMQWDVIPTITVTGLYKFACSTTDGVSVQARQTYPKPGFEWQPAFYVPGSYQSYAAATNSSINFSMPMIENGLLIYRMRGRATSTVPVTNNIGYSSLMSATSSVITNYYVGAVMNNGGRWYDYAIPSSYISVPAINNALMAPVLVLSKYGEGQTATTGFTVLYRVCNELEIKAYQDGWRP